MTIYWLKEHVETIRIASDECCCANCKHFVQHYARSDNGWIPVSVGHCRFPHIKSRTVNEICERFAQAEKR